jgi:hypothetical protein
MSAFTSKLRGAEWLVLVSSLVLFVMTLLPWFSLPGVNELQGLAPNAHLVGGGSEAGIHLNVWDLGLGRWFIYLSILLGVWMVLAAALSRTPEWSIILCTPLVISSFIALICLIVRVFDSPRPYAGATAWFYIAALAGAALFAGACWAIRDDTAPDGFEKAPRPDLIHVD